MVNISSNAVKREPLFKLTRIAHDYALVMPGFFISIIAFVLLVPLFALSVGTLVVWIGALLLPLTLLLGSAFAQLSRARVRRWGVNLPAAHYAPHGSGYSGLFRQMAEPRRWLDLAFETVIAFPLRIFTFVVATTWTVAAIAGITHVVWGVFLPNDDVHLAGLILEGITGGAAPDGVSQSLLLDSGFNFVIGCVFLLTLPSVMRGLAHLEAAATSAALGGSRRSAEQSMPLETSRNENSPGRGRSASSFEQSLSGENWTWIAAIFATIVSVAVNWPVLAVLYEASAIAAMLVAFAHGLALLLVIRMPIAGITVQTAAVVATVLTTTGVTQWPWPWPVMTLIIQTILILLVAMRRTWKWAAAAWLIPQIGALLTALPLGITSGGLSSIIVSSAVSLGILVIGVIIRQLVTSRGALREVRRTSTELSERRRELEERNRIAQELHDVVAHSMSVISVQATTAKYRLQHLGPEAENEFQSIAESSRQALSEMRSLLTLLRSTDEDREVLLKPQPTLTDIPSLIEASRASGASISLLMKHKDDSSETVGAAVPPATGLTAYRIVQEALSNAMRHSPGAEINVVVVENGHEITLDIINGAPDEMSTQPAAPGAGLGLAGVAERTTALGGSVNAGPIDSGGFSVKAVLPLR